jgi:hypothetical protein
VSLASLRVLNEYGDVCLPCRATGEFQGSSVETFRNILHSLTPAYAPSDRSFLNW